MIYAGGGILKARAAEALRELAELCDIHVVTTLMARGAFPDSHRAVPRHAGHARQLHRRHVDAAVRPAHRARAAASTTGSPARSPTFAPEAKIIHVDIDPAELGKVRRPDVPIVGDCRLVIEELVAVLKSKLDGGDAFPDRTAWKQTISGWQELHPLTYEQSEPGDALKPQFVLEQLRDNTPDDCIVACWRRPAPDVDVAVLEVRPPLHVGELRRPRHHGLRGAGRHRRQGRPARRAWCGPSTATAASR